MKSDVLVVSSFVLALYQQSNWTFLYPYRSWFYLKKWSILDMGCFVSRYGSAKVERMRFIVHTVLYAGRGKIHTKEGHPLYTIWACCVFPIDMFILYLKSDYWVLFLFEN